MEVGEEGGRGCCRAAHIRAEQKNKRRIITIKRKKQEIFWIIYDD